MRSDRRLQLAFLSTLLVIGNVTSSVADEPVSIWPDNAPGETTRNRGTVQPFRKNEIPPVTRVSNITEPTMTIHLPVKPNGSAVLILPGGGFGKVVPDKEGTEVAKRLNQHGVTAFVLSYRTRSKSDENGWLKPLQDAQRALALIRTKAKTWNVDVRKIGLVGFSAGGQVATRLICDGGKKSYGRVDSCDKTAHRPDFALLIYPWNIYDSKSKALVDQMRIPSDCPPIFLVHTDDDRSTSLGTVQIYAQLKSLGIPSELHIYGNGGHGYGMRPVKGSRISTWIDHATHWLQVKGIADPIDSTIGR